MEAHEPEDHDSLLSPFTAAADHHDSESTTILVAKVGLVRIPDVVIAAES